MSEVFVPGLEKLKEKISDIIYRSTNNARVDTSDLKRILDEAFTSSRCKEALYTLNTDSPFFGIRVMPEIKGSDAVALLTTDEKVTLVNYKIELDSKLFGIDLTVEEIVAIIVYEITAALDPVILGQVRRLVDFSLVKDETQIDIREFTSQTKLAIFAIKDTIYKLSSIMFVDDEDFLTNNDGIAASGLKDEILSANNKITVACYGMGDASRSPKTIILQWFLTMMKSMRINSMVIIDTLQDANFCTGSKLEKAEIEGAIKNVNKIDSEIPLKESLNKFFDRNNISSLNELSLFGKLKRSGLRSLEDDLYEYGIRVRNCRDADEAYSILRGINSRLGLLEDYMTNENISDAEQLHWQRVADQYRELRVVLAKKKFKEKSWGIFIDYNALDDLDNKKTDLI